MGRDRETQLQVGKNLHFITKHLGLNKDMVLLKLESNISSYYLIRTIL